jgi:hypothetical protein
MEEYVILLDLLATVVNTNQKFPDSVKVSGQEWERLLDAHYLANKFVDHSLTLLHLLYGTSFDLPSFKKRSKFIDSASIDVLVRTAMEAFLIFHYVFFAPDTLEEKEYRYLTYKVAGLAERQSFPRITEEHTKKLSGEKDLISALRTELESNKIYQNLKGNQKEGIFKGRGRWKWKPSGVGEWSWHDIAIDAGLSEMLARHMYHHLCGYAHSSSVSVLQTAQATLRRDGKSLVKSSIDTMKILVANMVREYCGVFPWVQDVLRVSGATNFVKNWVETGCRLDENIDLNPDSR